VIERDKGDATVFEVEVQQPESSWVLSVYWADMRQILLGTFQYLKDT
jgi:hypothetical protein